ncbi:hypothetical protein [Brevundimonas albigilva]|uniref:Uncharacterized protein n=1 Tax=Brevundimonas albigilva TaxID=1312364 RepID=A0ABY4SP76_9CAUL|nr:hypothetical protein [Brevundimonas albigilva]URI15915.1 hypothetical protein M8231_02680 [Brevundimonas albigilva]
MLHMPTPMLMTSFLWRFRGPLVLTVAVLASITSVSMAFKAGQEARARRVAEGQVAVLDKAINEPVVGLRDRLSACTADLGNAKTAVEAQNQAVDALKAEADARDARAREAVSAAQNRARTAERRVQALLQSSPREGETPCVAAERVIREQLG